MASASPPLLPCHPRCRGRLSLSSSRPFPPRFATRLKQGLTTQSGSVPSAIKTRGQAFRLLADPNMSSGRGSSINDVIMVDPLEAKRLAAKQMQQLQAKEKFQRRRKLEAINGAWAMIGLAAGLVVEGQTGKGILSQLAGYWDAFVRFFVQ
ncbi:uncharacterized protein LOC115736124 isoform X2 [Rhodamnia argentea]|uniref:Uncharacterized protein LOC115736124 isoform X2 n=1 Tax=Rhodamnia argentea TaxID=178133 RepID=A0A8B8NNF9_9MYRT|nr:uncharacterized protein LOC115736124 isoform X2 [Rhodamnia argentea]